MPSFNSLPTLEELEKDYPPYTCPVCLFAKDPDAKWAVIIFKNPLTGEKLALPVCMDCRNTENWS